MVRSSLTLEAAKTLVHVFVSSCLDYANSLLYGISDGLLAKLQTVQNAAAPVVTGTRKFDHITPVLHQLHWLPVRQRITFKLAMISTAEFITVFADFADVCEIKNTKVIYSAASASELRLLFNWRYINTHIHSFIQKT